MRRLATYKNGNTTTTIYDDGTKTHFTMDDEFNFEFPEAHDISSLIQCVRTQRLLLISSIRCQKI